MAPAGELRLQRERAIQAWEDLSWVGSSRQDNLLRLVGWLV